MGTKRTGVMNGKLNGMNQGFVRSLFVIPIRGELICKKDSVKLAPLQRLRNALPHLRLGKGRSDRAVRMGPRPDCMIHWGIHHKGIQVHDLFMVGSFKKRPCVTVFSLRQAQDEWERVQSTRPFMLSFVEV